jgi:acyl-CoA synthetase (AMP-forming)/AMP-acid ligase II
VRAATLFARRALLCEDGKVVPQGEPGEICVSGPLLAGGYWNLPEVTAETFRAGWLHTGDMAREGKDGFWYIVDRVKDMIVTGGFNVFPREVEDVAAEHSAIAQVSVIGTPDDTWGEAVTAVVVLRPGAPDDDTAIATMTSEIQAAVKERKGSVQSPKAGLRGGLIADEGIRQAGQEGAARQVSGEGRTGRSAESQISLPRIVFTSKSRNGRGLETMVAELAAQPGVRVASQPGSKALLDEDHPASLDRLIPRRASSCASHLHNHVAGGIICR